MSSDSYRLYNLVLCTYMASMVPRTDCRKKDSLELFGLFSMEYLSKNTDEETGKRCYSITNPPEEGAGKTDK